MGDEVPRSQTVRVGALSALLQELVRVDVPEPASAWDAALKPGAVIGRFELVREIGRGGFGVVWEARDPSLGRSVALKAVRPGGKADLREERLLREAEAAARLSHPNIVTLHDVGRTEHGPYLVLELLRGEALAQRLARGSVPLREALRIAGEAARGLAHAHAEGVIHRDLTPGNVFLCADGQVKVLDFGMAHAFGHRKVDGGTRAYMAPEQARGAPEDERTDVFALGVILHEMLSGELPFADAEALVESSPAPSLKIPEAPALGALAGRMLEKDPVKRPRDAGELLAALCVFQRELEHSPSGQPAVAVRGHRRRPTRLALTVAIALGAVLVGATVPFWLHGHSIPATPRTLRVAVLPFENLSRDPAQEYLGDGIAQEVAGTLSTVISVVAGSSVARFKRANPGTQAIGRELDVAFILEGSARRTAGRILVNAWLIRAADSRQVWSDRVDVPFDQVMEMQRSVAARVVAALDVFRPGHQLPLLKDDRVTRSAEAYDEYLQGRFASASVHTLERNREARLHFERALALDPAFAQAMALLAVNEISYYRMWGGGSDRLARAELLLSRALSVAPHLTFARDLHAELRGARWDYQGAAAEYSEWARDEPLNAEAWDGVCWALGYAWPRRLDEAERACVRAVDLDPNGEAKHLHWVRVLALQGKHAEAEKVQQQVERDVPGTDWVYWGRFVIAMEEGRPRDALAALQATSVIGNTGMAGQAGALAQAGQIDEAFARLDAALDAGYRDAADLRNSRWYEPLRKDPRFEKLLAEHGLGP